MNLFVMSTHQKRLLEAPIPPHENELYKYKYNEFCLIDGGYLVAPLKKRTEW